MSRLQFSEQFEYGWLYFRDNFIMPYIYEPESHSNDSRTTPNQQLSRAYSVIEDMIMEQGAYKRNHVEELSSRVVTIVSEHLFAEVLPPLTASQEEGKQFLLKVGDSWLLHKKRCILLLHLLFPQGEDSIPEHGYLMYYLYDRLYTRLNVCYKDIVYRSLANRILENVIVRILQTARTQHHSESVRMIADMVSMLDPRSRRFFSAEWENPLLAFAEVVLDVEKQWPGWQQGENVFNFLDFYGWLLFEGLASYLRDRDNSRNLISSFLEKIAPKVIKLLEEHRSKIAEVITNTYGEDEDEGEEFGIVMRWSWSCPAIAAIVCSIAKTAIANVWIDISTIYSNVINSQQDQCLISCERNSGTTCNCIGLLLHEFLAAFLDLWWKFNHVLELLSKDAELTRQFKQEVREFICSGMGKLLTSEVMADYYITLLGNVMKSPKHRKHCITLFQVAAFLQSTEEFKSDLKRKLASRLIKNPSSYRHACYSLNEEFHGSPSALESIEISQMVRETEHWNNENEEFATWIKGKEDCIEEITARRARSFSQTWTDDKTFRVATVRSGSWPAGKDTEIRMPEIVKTGLSLFERYYMPRNRERNLTWNKFYGRAVVTTSLFSQDGKGPIKLNLSISQFCVLNLFQEKDAMSVEEILQALMPRECDDDTKLNSEKFIMNALKSMLTAQRPVLKVVGQNKNIEKSDELQVNMEFRTTEELLILPVLD